MPEINKLIGLKKKAQKEGWLKFIRTTADEKALLKDCHFSFDAFDHFRFFVENFIKLSKGKWAGKNLELMPYQEEICGSLFGWLRDDGFRRFRRGYVEIPKKSGKTTLFSAIGNYMFVGDGEASSEVYCCANDRDQAAILWNLAADSVEASPILLKQVKVLRSTKTMTAGAQSWFRAWSSDVSSKDGPNAHCILVDELHAWRGNAARDFWRKIRYAGVARAQPIVPLVITTAGDDRHSLCYEQHSYASRLLSGTAEDLAFFAYIQGVSREKMKTDKDYWKKEAAWREANPAIDVVLSKEDFETDVKECENDPRAKAMFLRYRLNYWIDSDNPWLAGHVWAKNCGPDFTEGEMAGQVCFAGLDLSSVQDFTAVVYCFPRLLDSGEKRFRLIARIFCPEERLQERIRKLDIDLRVWIEQGYITVTPGDSIDHQFIFDKIKADAELFQVREMGYDRHCAAWIIQQMQRELPNIELFPISQSMTGLSAATKAFTGALLQARVEHGGNPVLAWMASNAVPESDAQDNLRLHKGRSKDKIDGIIAAIMAYNQAELGDLDAKKKFSVYDSENFSGIMADLEGLQV